MESEQLDKTLQALNMTVDQSLAASLRQIGDATARIAALPTRAELLSKSELDRKLAALATSDSVRGLATSDHLTQLATSMSRLATADSVTRLATAESVSRLATADSVNRLTASVGTLATAESVGRLATADSVARLATAESVSGLATAESVSRLSTSIGALATADSVNGVSRAIASLGEELRLSATRGGDERPAAISTRPSGALTRVGDP